MAAGLPGCSFSDPDSLDVDDGCSESEPLPLFTLSSEGAVCGSGASALDSAGLRAAGELDLVPSRAALLRICVVAGEVGPIIVVTC